MFFNLPNSIHSTLLSSFTGIEAKFSTKYTHLDDIKHESSFPIVGLNQVHGNDIKIVEKITDFHDREYVLIGEGDGLITGKSRIRLSICTADCVPILMYDSKRRVLAAIHSGWRSTLKSISLKAIDKLQQHFGSHTKDIFVSMGPAICSDCFEVGDEVISLFRKVMNKDISFFSPQLPYFKKNGKYYLDLKQIITAQLIAAAVPSVQIENLNRCTLCEDIFPSYRGGDNKKRMYGIISLS